MIFSRSTCYVAIVLCTVLLVKYEILQNLEAGTIFNFSVFDIKVNNIHNAIEVLERTKNITSDPNDTLDIDSSIAFLKSRLDQRQETTRYFATDKTTEH